MSIVRNNTVIMWKGFAFPMSIETFKIKEEANVATYTYAGRNGAEQERVLKYRVFSLSGIFTSDSGDKDPSYYVNKLRSLNDNEPGVLAHPVLGTYRCIIKDLEIIEAGAELEGIQGKVIADTKYLNVSGINMSGGGATTLGKVAKSQATKVDYRNRAIANFRFNIEFWESIPPTAASLQTAMNKLFPASTAKPLSDNYQTSSKYKTVNELYWALVNGQIAPGTDPIRNAEWLAYDYTFRKTAYDMWIADPKGTQQSTSDSSLKITTPKSQNVYTVAVGDTALKIAKKLNTTSDTLFQANTGKKVRTVPRGTEGLYWKKISTIYPGDTLIIP